MSTLGALVTRIEAAGVSRIYEIGKVPHKPASPYVVVSLNTGTPSNYTVAGTTNHSVYRITVQMFGQTWDSLRSLATTVDGELQARPLVEFTGSPIARRELSTDVVRDDDGEGLLYILHTYLF